jgi:cell division protein FtsZ
MRKELDNIIYLGLMPDKEVMEDEKMATSIPSVDLEDFEIPEEEELTVEDESGGSLTFGFIGLGQCGSRLAEAFYKLGYKKNIVINTAEQDLKKISVPNKMLIQLENMRGGAGKNMDIARETIEAEKNSVYNKMREIFGNVTNIFVCAGLGGGTGGGSIATALEISKKYMKYIDVEFPEERVGAIVTLPTMGETSSPLVAGNAYQAAHELSTLADKGKISPVIIVDNAKVESLYKKLTVAKFFPTINNSVAQLLNIFNVISVEPSEYISFDSTDFQSVLESGGHTIMGVSVVRDFTSPTSISEALKKNLSKTLLASNFDLSTAQAVACVVIGGEEEFNTVEGLMDNINYGFDTIASFTGEAKVHRGVYSDENRNGSIAVYTLIGGLKKPTERYKKMKNKG